ncbi:hypothetical protein SELMODRAFT_426818 [Selaginella moellendorffii]|uniref:Uncharacterized protein n=1 Tax=Selaginella moellendorffii TaxID=88036 RepID=D8SXL2_SELML|nr:hypothetical protein SELMODRAFT_426818 [Selaginella moellendorffii]
MQMGRSPCCEKIGLNRGPWTREEDALLMQYVNEHGEGSWRTLPKAADLLVMSSLKCSEGSCYHRTKKVSRGTVCRCPQEYRSLCGRGNHSSSFFRLCSRFSTFKHLNPQYQCVVVPHPDVEQQPSTPKPSAPELQQLSTFLKSSAPVERNNSRSPEQLNLIAFRLAVLEKFATGLGKLAFVWATVVLLGGFVSNIPAKDFWTISALLLTEGTRVFSRSSELEWQQANYSLGILGFRSFLFDKSARLWEKFSGVLDHDHSEQNVSRDRLSKKPVKKDLHQGFAARRIWCVGSAYVKFLPTRIISLFMYFLQLASATVTACFSVYRLAEHGFNAQGNNTEQALTVFYAMMLAETSLFLLERTYWEFKLRYQRLLEVVTRTCELDQDDIETMKQYWYTLYSRSLNGSVFDGLGMDLIDFTVEKLQSSIREEQLGSVNILSALVSKGDSMEETQRRIGTTPGVVERLLEMITWKDPSEAEIRKAATIVIKHLVRHSHNCFRISAIPGSLEALTALLPERQEEVLEEKSYRLTILNGLAVDYRTCVRIGHTSGLLSILVEFIQDEVRTSKEVFRPSLDLLKTLASVRGDSGRSLRKKMVSVVPAVRSLQRICNLEDLELQDLAVDVIKLLATEDELRDCIGATGGVIQSLMAIFTRETAPNSDQLTGGMRAGEAIIVLVFQCPNNCSRLLMHKSCRQGGVSKTLKSLINMLTKPVGVHAATILQSLCGDLNDEEKLELGAAISRIIQMVLESTDKEQQAAIGLAAAIIPWLDRRNFEQGVLSQQSRLCEKFTELLSHTAPSRSLNRIRRYSVELLNSLVAKDARFLRRFREDGEMEASLGAMLATASDEENFLTFSDFVGLTKHSSSLEELVNSALLNLHRAG